MARLDYSNVSNSRLFELIKYHSDSQGRRYLKAKNKTLFMKNKRERIVDNKIQSIKKEIRARDLKYPRPNGTYKAALAVKKRNF